MPGSAHYFEIIVLFIPHNPGLGVGVHFHFTDDAEDQKVEVPGSVGPSQIYKYQSMDSNGLTPSCYATFLPGSQI